MDQTVDIAVIGAGAAGLFASIWAGREGGKTPLTPLRRASGDLSPFSEQNGEREGTRAGSPCYGGGLRVLALDGAKKLGAKILVAGGGRCNVTHHAVDENQYAGSSRNAIKKVLGRFDVPETVAFFREAGVTLKREDTGKLFPTTDDAHTVLNALLAQAARAGVEIVHPWRVASVHKVGDLFEVSSTPPPLPAGEVAESARPEGEVGESEDVEPGADGDPDLPLRRRKASATSPAGGGGGVVRAKRVILATGGMALPKTGSDGAGYDIARALGHTTTPRIFPALVPLTLPKDHWVCSLMGITLEATLELRAATGKKLKYFTNSTLCTHFGLSGPSVLDISRYYTAARQEDAGARLVFNWLPGETMATIDPTLQQLGKVSPGRFLRERGLPERVAEAICAAAGVDPSAPAHALTRDNRKILAQMIVETPLPISGDRGFTYAEVTAGGVPLSEIHLETMESRLCPGLHLCGEICDVDGRIGGFNFQWAWASGFVAGTAAARDLLNPSGS